MLLQIFSRLATEETDEYRAINVWFKVMTYCSCRTKLSVFWLLQTLECACCDNFIIWLQFYRWIESANEHQIIHSMVFITTFTFEYYKGSL